jgi:hypothetical protein
MTFSDKLMEDADQKLEQLKMIKVKLKLGIEK